MIMKYSKMIAIKLAGTMMLCAYVTGIFAQDNTGKVASIPVLTLDQFNGRYEPTCLSNGFIGFRPGLNPLAAAPVTVAGFTRALPYLGNESLCPAPDPMAMKIELDGQRATIRTVKQALDLANGELTTELEASIASGKRANIKVVQFASRSIPCVLAQEIMIHLLQDVRINLVVQVLMNDAPVDVYRKGAYYQEEMWDHVLGVRTDRSKLGIAVVAGGESVKRVSPGTFIAEGKAGKGWAELGEGFAQK